MKNNFKIVTILMISIIGIAFLNSCCDDDVCNCDNVAEYGCSPREVTLSEFKPQIETTKTELLPANSTFLTANSIIYYPTNNYYIQSFTFPKAQYNSGLLSADENYRLEIGISKNSVLKYPLSMFDISSDYYVAILDSLPINSEIKGDIVVKELNIDATNILNSYAIIRVKGEIAHYDNDLFSESSTDFCSYISTEFYTPENEINKGEVISLRNKLSEYGKNLPQCQKVAYNQDNISILNSENKQLYNFDDNKIQWESFTGKKAQYDEFLEILPIIQNSQTIITNGILSQKYNVYEIKIKIGEVYLYRSTAGRDYLMAMTNIEERDSPLTKSKKRMTIMYNEL